MRKSQKLKAVGIAPDTGEPIPLLNTEKILVAALIAKKKEFDELHDDVLKAIALRVGIKPSDIGTKYGLFGDALVPQPQSD